jgi:hypothetical protein
MGMGKGGTQSKQPTAIKSVRIQTSAYGAVRPIVYGTTRVSCNVIWTADFFGLPKLSESSGGK